MMKYRRPVALLAAALLGCVLLSGCGKEPLSHTDSTTESTAPGELKTTAFEITEEFRKIRVEGGDQ